MSMYNVRECVCPNSALKSLSQMKTKFTWDHHGIEEKIYSNDSGQLLFFISSPKPKAHRLAYRILMVRRPSGVHRLSSVVRPSVHNAQRSSSPKPLGQSKPNFMWSLLG